jgi:exopolysaccharide/PEP-CTERM locus tyrosine autokinase
MEIVLRIVSDPHAQLLKQRERVFGEHGGDIGRAADSYWPLPDPNCYLSGHHCRIFFRDGAFWVRDTSVNGVYVNGSMRPIGCGREARLAHGDQIKFAHYTAVVRVRMPRKQRPESTKGDMKHEAIEPEELFAEVFAATLVNESENVPQPEPAVEHQAEAFEAESKAMETTLATATRALPATKLEGNQEHEDASLQEPEPVAYEAVEPVDPGNAGTGARAADPEPAAKEQPADIPAMQSVDPALLLHTRHRTIHIDRDRLQRDGNLPSDKMRRLLLNQFRHIKRPVIKNALGRGREPVPNGQLVMVTSSLPGEGKTFSSLNLALSIAREKDLEVLLIDADAAKSTLSRILDLEEAPGLLNALADDRLDVESLILPTDVQGLSLLPAGQCAEEDVATELLASARMDEIVARIGASSAQRIALFDSPPLLVTNEARVLASLMGQILLVVRAGVTPQQAVLEAIRYVDEDKPLGLVLNQSMGHAPGSYYGYGAYGYGDYGADETSGGTGVGVSRRPR